MKTDQEFLDLIQFQAEKRKTIHYDEAKTFSVMDRLIETFSPEYLRSLQGKGDLSDQPVFIVGMLRSGSSLLEQVIASHPDVYGVGESKEFLNTLMVLLPTHTPEEKLLDVLIQRLMHLDPGLLQNIGFLYSEYRGKFPHKLVLDKMLLNFRFCGLIHLVFPKAKIIHIKRSPIDTCLSIFRHNFNEEHGYSHDLRELGRYYNHYRKMMAYWEKHIPIFEIWYEDIVANFEPQIRRTLEFLGLEWHPNCLEFYKTDRECLTASAEQVKKPLFDYHRGRPSLHLTQPLFDELNEKPPKSCD